MAILGFVFSFLVLGYLSFCILLIGAHGGLDCGPIGIKNLWWYIPLLGLIGYLWYLLFKYSPFSIVIS